LDISGNDNSEEQPANIPPIFSQLLVIHFDISGNVFNDLQFKNTVLTQSISP